MNRNAPLSTRQEAIVEKCFHPTGAWEELPESEYESSVPARFESIVARYPDRLALVDDQVSLTYMELNVAANQVAHGLLEQLGEGNEPVIHLFEQSVEAIIAVLGILKAGKFYVPLNNGSPPKYLRRIIETMDSTLLLTDSPNLDLAIATADHQIDVRTLSDISVDVSANPNIPIQPDDYLYVVFTSGSTGAPKGVIDIHRNVLRFAADFSRRFHIGFEDRCLKIFRLSFSGSLSTLYGTLLFGSSAFLYDIHRQGIEHLPGWISQHRLTILAFTPPAFRLFAEASAERPDFSSVRLLRLGGDSALPTDLTTAWRLFPATAVVWTGYGASEAKGIADMLYDKRSGTGIQEMATGWPFKGLEVLLVDDEGNRLPTGAVGEIVVRSRYNSPGYWKQPELTRTKFRPDPTAKGITLYQTGDLGRIDDDGLLYHMGRVDSQVKIGGQRVELGEIEHTLLDMDEVDEAVVLVRGGSIPQQRLLAWLVWKDPNQPLTVSELRRRLAERLPAYMIPAAYIPMKRFPLNANGKIDRRSLPAPDHQRPALDSAYAPPQTPFELELAQIWREILGFQEIGVDDNFFELGGDSIRAMQMLSRVQQRINATLHIQAIFDAPTIAKMAIYLTVSYIEQHQKGHLDPTVASSLPATGNSTTTVGVTADAIARFRALRAPAIDMQPRPTAKNPPALFILAPPRSGTTLLRVMLAGHDRLFAPPELYLLNHYNLAERSRLNEGRMAYRLEGSVRALMALHDCNAETALEMMADYENQHLSTQAFYATLQSAAGARLLVDKTPVYASHADILRRAESWFDQPLYVHLSRHPAATIHSYVESHFHLRNGSGGEFSPNQLAELTWLTYHENIRAFLDTLPAGRQLHIRYEDLVTTPETAMVRLCNHLGIDFQSEMLDPYGDARSRMTDGLYPQSTMIGDPTFHRFSEVSTASVDAWRTALGSTGSWRGELSLRSIEIAERFGYTDD